jgi:peptide/nickel transport system permease protein
MADMTLNEGARLVANLRQERERKAESPWQVALRRFRKHRMAVLGVGLMALILLFCIVGAFFISEEYSNTPGLLLGAQNKNQPPSAEHIFGTDGLGRDIFARIIYGGQISLMIAIVSVAISISLGTVVGLVAGYFGGWIESVLMRFVEALLAIPPLILLLLFSRALSGTTSTIVLLGRELSVTVVAIVLIIGLTNWMSLSRIVRSLVLSLKEQDYIVAARSIGVGDARIIFSHILPNVMAPIIVQATLSVGAAIITEAYLSFLGFGVTPPTATWGNILTRAQTQLEENWWIWMAPGAFIVMTVLAINFIGDGLRDALDPRSTK